MDAQGTRAGFSLVLPPGAFRSMLASSAMSETFLAFKKIGAYLEGNNRFKISRQDLFMGRVISTFGLFFFPLKQLKTPERLEYFL